MPSLKLKFKLELIEKIIKSHPNQLIFFEEFQNNKLSSNDISSKHNTTVTMSSNFTLSTSSHTMIPKTKFPPHSKYSVRTGKPYTGDFETLPGYDTLFFQINNEDKEEASQYMKTLEPSSLYQMFSLLSSSKSLYSKLKNKNGLEMIKNVYKDMIQRNKPENKGGNNNLNEINDECELYICLKDIMNINDIDSCEIFNLFKYNNFCSFGISHFILLIYLFLAFEGKEIEDYTTIFGEDLFKEISASENFITVSRMKKIGNIIGIKEKEMETVLNDLNYSIYTEIDENNFKEFYKKLGKKIKTEANQSNNSTNSTNSNTGLKLSFIKNSQNINSNIPISNKDKSSFTMGYGKFYFNRK